MFETERYSCLYMLMCLSSFKEEGRYLLQIPVDDYCDSDIYSKFEAACRFVGKYLLGFIAIETRNHIIT